MKYNRHLHRFAVFTSFCTFLLIIAGGLVTSTQSGLAVPDWPLSYGQLMPPMVGGIFYEHGHRMIAAFVGFLTIILALWIWKKDDRGWMRKLGFVALGAVVIQGLLGGITVLFYLPTAISVSHATLAQSFFSLTGAIALFTSRWWRSSEAEISPRNAEAATGRGATELPMLAIVTTASVFVQLIIGALMRHTGSGLAVPDFPLAYGQLFPTLSTEAVGEYNQQLIHSDVRIAAEGPITASQIVIHMIHRFWAIVVAGLVVWTSIRLVKASVQPKRFSFFAAILLSLLVLQITLGALAVLSVKNVAFTTAHVAGGALMLATCVVLSLHAIKLFGLRISRRSYVYSSSKAVA